MRSAFKVLARLASADMAATGGTSIFVMVVEGVLSFAAGFFGYEQLKNGIETGKRYDIGAGVVQIVLCVVLAYCAVKWPQITARYQRRKAAAKDPKIGRFEALVLEEQAFATLVSTVDVIHSTVSDFYASRNRRFDQQKRLTASRQNSKFKVNEFLLSLAKDYQKCADALAVHNETLRVAVGNIRDCFNVYIEYFEGEGSVIPESKITTPQLQELSSTMKLGISVTYMRLTREKPPLMRIFKIWARLTFAKEWLSAPAEDLLTQKPEQAAALAALSKGAFFERLLSAAFEVDGFRLA